jgi:hypothetical protein
MTRPHGHKRLMRFAYPVTAVYLTIMVTHAVALLLSGADVELDCRC